MTSKMYFQYLPKSISYKTNMALHQGSSCSTLHSLNHNGDGAELEFFMRSKVRSVYLIHRLAILVSREVMLKWEVYHRVWKVA